MEFIIEFLRSRPEFESRLGRVFLYTRFFVLDTRVTGNTKIDQLTKAEKTMLGIKFERTFMQEFKLQRGDRLDCNILGQEVDIKFTCRNNWMIPPKCFDSICLLAKMDDYDFSLGIINTSTDVLTKSENWDRKKQLCVGGKSSIRWIYEHRG